MPSTATDRVASGGLVMSWELRMVGSVVRMEETVHQLLDALREVTA